MARLKEQYVNEIAPALNKKFGYKSVMQIPKLDKVIINVAAGEAKENVKVIDAIVADLGQITGQQAVEILTGAKSVSETAIGFDTTLEKKFNAANCEALGITPPDGYEAIG